MGPKIQKYLFYRQTLLALVKTFNSNFVLFATLKQNITPPLKYSRHLNAARKRRYSKQASGLRERHQIYLSFEQISTSIVWSMSDQWPSNQFNSFNSPTFDGLSLLLPEYETLYDCCHLFIVLYVELKRTNCWQELQWIREKFCPLFICVVSVGPYLVSCNILLITTLYLS